MQWRGGDQLEVEGELTGGAQAAVEEERKGTDTWARAGSDWKKKEKGERGRCWAATANGPEEGAGPCGEHGPQ
jgi:hypothetical protein